METRQIEFEGRSSIIRTRNRKTPILEARYSDAIRKKYPEVLTYEVAMFQVPPPKGMDLDSDEFAQYVNKTGSARSFNHVGSEIYFAMIAFTPVLARFMDCQHCPFSIDKTNPNEPRFQPEQVLLAFEDFLDEDIEYDPAKPPVGFWSANIREINALDAPITSKIDQPPNHLSEGETKDPLSAGQEQSEESAGNANATTSPLPLESEKVQ